MARPIKDMTGVRVGKLVVVSLAERGKFNEVRWNCLCDCGTPSVVDANALKQGSTKSCGCIKRDIQRERIKLISPTPFLHGKSHTPEYESWKSMFYRCRDKREKVFKYYGARGIRICSRWSDFTKFLEDMGPRPEGWQLDRINNNGHYVPSNCRWATRSDNLKNTCRSKSYRDATVIAFEDVV